MSQLIIGRKGRKNCLVTGIIRLVRSSVATAVLVSGPGLSMIDSEKMPSTASRRYCAS